ncbi:hypothetical protein EVAR_92297_1 [Eumeta japonica]|uniref:Uncharacterized protein n=1 Tax=Eumeta variegata TaxID=151549 RepID=A0A4C1TM61_EUMVA|nr:hypothetical protein EVAR_92297_1 [Eumeta japonica]
MNSGKEVSELHTLLDEINGSRALDCWFSDIELDLETETWKVQRSSSHRVRLVLLFGQKITQLRIMASTCPVHWSNELSIQCSIFRSGSDQFKRVVQFKNSNCNKIEPEIDATRPTLPRLRHR